MENNSFYSEEEVRQLGFKHIGSNVLISKKCSLYGMHNISIGNNVRIDDFCILSGKIQIGDYVHIAAYVGLFAGQTGIEIGNYCGISSRSTIYAESDDYGGGYLTNPTVPEEYKNIICGKVVMQKHALIGSGCTVLPGVVLGEGASVGSMSFINKSLPEWTVSFGIPCKVHSQRKKDLLVFENQMLGDNK